MGLSRAAGVSFGGVESESENPRFSILSVPYDLTASYVSGARNGPAAIIEASTHMELYDEELGTEPWREGIETLAPIEPTTLGPEKMVERVYETSKEVVEAGRCPVLLGGEHSVTLGLVRALREYHGDISVLQLDAHADMRESYQESPYNHACVARRISEHCALVQLGIRSLSGEEAEFLSSANGQRVKTFYAKDVLNGGDLFDNVAKKVVSALGPKVFVTIDLDVFDPSIMPSTGTPEPGGLGWYGALSVLREVAKEREVVGFDVVELSPVAGNVAPDFMAAKLVYKFMGYISRYNAFRGD